MKAKSIRKVLRSKIDAWAKTVDDPTVKDHILNDTIVTGGCIVSMFLGEKVNDFDVYFRSMEAVLAVSRYYVAKFERKQMNGIPVKISVEQGAQVSRDVFDRERVHIKVKSAGVASEEGTEIPYSYFEGRPDDEADQYVGSVMDDVAEIEAFHDEVEAMALEEREGAYRPVFLSSNAITLSDQIQIVVRFWGKPEEIHANYDFVHCTGYWCAWNNELTMTKDNLEAILTKELRYVGSKYPLCSLIRIRKFVQRGWSINAGQMLKMVMQLQGLDLTDHFVLQDQLTGVDAAYFIQLVEKLREKDPDKVNAAYLIEIVDRMF